LHDPRLPGKPDIVLPCQRIAIFSDGDFWHGRHWAERRRRLSKGANASYWIAKISRNINRGRRINQILRRLNWNVIRVWESDIICDPQGIADEIAHTIQMKLQGLKELPQATLRR
jgi:DNA mismatch endonuclease (patch repair protein)